MMTKTLATARIVSPSQSWREPTLGSLYFRLQGHRTPSQKWFSYLSHQFVVLCHCSPSKLVIPLKPTKSYALWSLKIFFPHSSTHFRASSLCTKNMPCCLHEAWTTVTFLHRCAVWLARALQSTVTQKLWVNWVASGLSAWWTKNAFLGRCFHLPHWGSILGSLP